MRLAPQSTPTLSPTTPSSAPPPPSSIDCPGAAPVEFVCIDGLWVAISLNVSEPSSLTGNAQVNGNLTVVQTTLVLKNTSLFVTGKLSVKSGGVLDLTLNGGKTVTTSSFVLESASSLRLSGGDSAPLKVHGCAELAGNLEINVDPTLVGTEFST